jgi:mono/diheme cytochrome c family protein
MRAPLALASAAAALVTILAACASSPPIADPSGPYAQGERIYRSHCAACHRLRAPSSATGARWAWAVEK